MKNNKTIIDARKDSRWFEKVIDVLAQLLPLQLIGDDEQITQVLNLPEFAQYSRAMRANAGKWSTEFTLPI
jgi:hypothetical protein